jgi:hypothetical protein
MKWPIFVTVVSMTLLCQKSSLVNPHIFCVKVMVLYSIVQDNLPMHVFSIDIPFKGSQILSNMTSSGVNETAVHVTSVLLKPRCKYDTAVTLDLIFER